MGLQRARHGDLRYAILNKAKAKGHHPSAISNEKTTHTSLDSFLDITWVFSQFFCVSLFALYNILCGALLLLGTDGVFEVLSNDEAVDAALPARSALRGAGSKGKHSCSTQASNSGSESVYFKFAHHFSESDILRVGDSFDIMF